MRLLSLDGGGVFGVGQAMVLSEIDNSAWDAAAGTSIGSVMAASVALGKPVSVSFFRKHMPGIFRRRWHTNPVFSSRYRDRELNESLSSIFGGAVMKDSPIPLYITASSIGRKSLKVFSSVSNEDADMLISDAVRASCAAQTYFRPWMGYGDGGVFANNPSVVAVSKCVSDKIAEIDEIDLFSIGTGVFRGGSGKSGDGILFWSKWLTEALFEGGSDRMFSDIAEFLPVRSCHRFQFVKKDGWRMDSVEDMEKAIAEWQYPAMTYGAEIRQAMHGEDSVLSLAREESQEVLNEVLK